MNKIIIIASIPAALITLTQLMFARALGPEAMGLYATAMLLFNAVIAITNLNIDKDLIVNKIDASEFRALERIEKIWGVYISLGIIAAAILIINYEMAIKVDWEVVALLIIAANYSANTRIKAELELQKHYSLIYTAQIKAQVIAGIAAIMALIAELNVIVPIIWRTLVLFSEYMLLGKRKDKTQQVEKIKKLNYKKKIEYLKYFYINNIFGVLVPNIDMFALTITSTSREIGNYWLAFSLSHGLLIIRDTMNRIMLVELSSFGPIERKKIYIKMKIKIITITIICAILGIIYGKIFIGKIFGPEFLPAGEIIWILIAAVGVKYLSALNTTYDTTFGSKEIIEKTMYSSIVVGMPILFFGAYYGGLVGAATAVLVSSIITTTMQEAMIRKRMKI